MVIDEKSNNIITAILLLFFNIIMFFSDDSHTIDRYVNLLIPTIALIFIYIFRNKKLFLFYALIGVLITIFGTYGNFSGSIFFFFSVTDNRTIKNIYFNLFLLISSLCVKICFIDYFTPHIFSMLIAYYFILSHLYVRYWNTYKEPKIKNIGLTVEQIQTVKMLIQGRKHQSAADFLNIDRKTYSARVSSLRSRYNVETDFQLAIKLIESDIISLNSIAKEKID